MVFRVLCPALAWHARRPRSGRLGSPPAYKRRLPVPLRPSARTLACEFRPAPQLEQRGRAGKARRCTPRNCSPAADAALQATLRAGGKASLRCSPSATTLMGRRTESWVQSTRHAMRGELEGWECGVGAMQEGCHAKLAAEGCTADPGMHPHRPEHVLASICPSSHPPSTRHANPPRPTPHAPGLLPAAMASCGG